MIIIVVIIIAVCYNQLQTIFSGAGVKIGSDIFKILIGLPVEDYADVEWMADCIASVKRVQNYIKQRLGNETFGSGAQQRRYADSSMLKDDANGIHLMANWHFNVGKSQLVRDKLALIMEAVNAEIKSMHISKLRRAKEGFKCNIDMWLFQYGLFFSKYGHANGQLRPYALEVLTHINDRLYESINTAEPIRTYVYTEKIQPESLGLTKDKLDKFNLHMVSPDNIKIDPKHIYKYEDKIGNIRYRVTKYQELIKDPIYREKGARYLFIDNANPTVDEANYDNAIYSFN